MDKWRGRAVETIYLAPSTLPDGCSVPSGTVTVEFSNGSLLTEYPEGSQEAKKHDLEETKRLVRSFGYTSYAGFYIDEDGRPKSLLDGLEDEKVREIQELLAKKEAEED